MGLTSIVSRGMNVIGSACYSNVHVHVYTRAGHAYSLLIRANKLETSRVHELVHVQVYMYMYRLFVCLGWDQLFSYFFS